MKKDKYEQLKPEVFNFEDNFTPTLKIGAIAAIVYMIAVLILFGAFLWFLFSMVPIITKGL